ncbi:MAG: hypothetical protein ACK4S6_18145 [Roseateles asaccharophilus]|uniref:DUF7931 domain-containing protein n=1 Tax=Roseateles asaccharophilus TaxID=582607 RepID=A0A4V3CK41_9BURK|nr:hypothetical protein [Roseateles asaccharophilus]MDN3543446.1 hypothetical protein [Roseateles asaccharophilus]TDP12176.1 hypothetical protein DFR39_102569 [Roseateles asaccharophilus]
MDITEGVISGREAFVQALTACFQRAAQEGCRELCLWDADFAHWPLSSPEVLDALRQWALPHRRLRLLATQYEDLRRLHPRFVSWRRHWDHVVEARAYEPQDLSGGGPQGLMLGQGLFSLRLLDARLWRAAYSGAAADELAARESFDAVWQRSCESFSASTLGL